MWLLEFPDFVYHIILGIGIIGTLAGFVLNFIPFIKQYSFPIQVISVLVLTLGVYLQGGLSVKADLEKEVADLKVKLANAETQSEKINTEVVTRVVTKREVVKEKGKAVVEYIDREVVKYNDKCEIPKEVIISHNAAAQNKSIDEVLTPNTAIDTKEHNSLATRSAKK
jgi:hypothetical protein